LKLADFGLARTTTHGQNKICPMTENVVTRYYRAPEVFMGYEDYSFGIDVWSAGCVMAEFVIRKTLFNGSDSYDMLAQIVTLIGKPNENYLASCRKEKKIIFIKMIDSSKTEQNRLSNLLKNDVMCDLVKGCLTFETENRLKAVEALSHPFFLNGNDESLQNEITNHTQPLSSTISITINEFEKKFSKVYGIQKYRAYILRDISIFHNIPIEVEEEEEDLYTNYSTSDSYKTCKSQNRNNHPLVNRIEDKFSKCTIS